MEWRGQWLSRHGPQASPAPQLLHTFVLPETYSQGSANVLQLPRQVQTLPAATAAVVWQAPQATQIAPAGLQMTSYGCYLAPQVFYTQGTSTHLPPPATSTMGHGAASLLVRAVPEDPGGQPQHPPPRKKRKQAVPSGPSVLRLIIRGSKHTKEQSGQSNISSMDTSMGQPQSSEILTGSNVPPSSSSASSRQGIEDTVGDLQVNNEMLFQEAPGLSDCYWNTVRVSQDGPSSSSMPGITGREGRAVAPVPPVLLTSIPGDKYVEGQSVPTSISGTAIHMETAPGSNMPPGINTPASPSADLKHQEMTRDKDLLEEFLRLLDGCLEDSLDTMGFSQEVPSSSSMPGDVGGTGATTPTNHCGFLSVPEDEQLSPNYSLPEITNTTLGLEELDSIGLEPLELWGDAWMDLPPF